MLRQFLGFVNFYRRFLPNVAAVQAPLNQFLVGAQKNDKREVPWTEEAEKAFNKTKTDLAEATLLSHPSMDAPTRVVSDASDTQLGGALEQLQRGAWRPLALLSRKFTPAQTRYSAYDRELTAIYESIKAFKHFLEGRDFLIVTDHKPLIHAFQQRLDKASPRQRRQLSFISQYSTRLEYIPGVNNVVVDAWSRVETIRLPLEFDLVELARLQKDDPELAQLRESSDHSLNLKCIKWGEDHNRIFCDLSGPAFRPYIPAPLRKRVFELFHNPAHGSAKVTDQVIRQRYVWPDMQREIKALYKNCLDCQQSKISRHDTTNPSQFTAPDGRFQDVHMDIIGPMTNCDGYCLTLIDRFSRWTEAIPLKDITAQTVSRAFFDNWISRFGAPRLLTTDQGAQFESQLFAALLSLIGCQRIRTTAYHPAANGMIERWHRSLKAAIMCHNDRNWLRQLSTVLLGLRTHVRLDTGASPAEYLYGTTLRVPGEFFLFDDFSPNPQIFLEEFREHMRNVQPVPVAHRHKKRGFFFKELHTCSHVFLKIAATKSH